MLKYLTLVVAYKTVKSLLTVGSYEVTFMPEKFLMRFVVLVPCVNTVWSRKKKLAMPNNDILLLVVCGTVVCQVGSFE